MSIETGKTTNALNLLLEEVQANPAEAAWRIQQLDALVGQLKGELQELEAVLLAVYQNYIGPYESVAFDLLHRRRLDPEARADLIKAYLAWRAQETTNG